MPIGVILVSGCVAVGGVLGNWLGKHIPERVVKAINFTFGIICIVIGVVLIVKISALPAVVLALILGVIIGELLRLEDRVSSGTLKLQKRFGRGGHSALESGAKMERFMAVAVLLCTGANGLMGALYEGFSGDASLLISKAIMDLLCAAMFASSLGIMVALIAIPQFIILLALYFVSGWILPITTPEMLGDLYACGGAISIITGLRIAEIKQYKVINILPALVLILPVSALWSRVAAVFIS